MNDDYEHESEEPEAEEKPLDCGRTKPFGFWYHRIGAVRWISGPTDVQLLNDLQKAFAGRIRILLAPEDQGNGVWGMSLYLAPVPVSQNSGFCETSWSNFDRARGEIEIWVEGYKASQQRKVA